MNARSPARGALRIAARAVAAAWPPVLACVLLPVLHGNASAAAAGRPAAETVVARADAVRNPDRPFERRLRLTEYVDGSPRNETVLHIWSKVDPSTGQFRNLVRYLEPPRDLGKAVLMNGTTLWFYDPAARTSVRISAQQRLLGQAAQGDVATVNFARDYKAAFAGPEDGETLTDADHQPRQCWHVELAPANDSAVYGRAEYWVEKDTFRPVKGKFYSDSGRLLKVAYYHRFTQELGSPRPTEIILIDAVNSKLVTTLDSFEARASDIPDTWYQRDYLPRAGD